MVYGGKEQERYDSIDMYSVMDVGGRLTYQSNKNEKEIVVYGDEEFIYDEAYYLANVNGVLTYKAVIETSSSMYYDGEKQLQYELIKIIAIGEDEVVYLAKEGEKMFVVYNGEEQKRYDKIEDIKKINNKLIYLAEEGDSGFVVYNGEEQKKYDSVGHALSVDDKLVYPAKKGKEEFMVYNGEEQQKYKYPQKINSRTINKINEKLVYLVEDVRQHFYESFIVYDNKEQKKYENIDQEDLYKKYTTPTVNNDDNNGDQNVWQSGLATTINSKLTELENKQKQIEFYRDSMEKANVEYLAFYSLDYVDHKEKK
jgi:hypothetical protein